MAGEDPYGRDWCGKGPLASPVPTRRSALVRVPQCGRAPAASGGTDGARAVVGGPHEGDVATQLFRPHGPGGTGVLLPFAIEVDGAFAGQLTLGNVQHGVVCSCWIGYWVYSGFSGRGVASSAVALGVDHAMTQVGMHRVEATVLESNVASRRVLEKVGFREEGLLQRNLHINGQWRDHVLVGLTVEERPSGLAR